MNGTAVKLTHKNRGAREERGRQRVSSRASVGTRANDLPDGWSANCPPTHNGIHPFSRFL